MIHSKSFMWSRCALTIFMVLMTTSPWFVTYGDAESRQEMDEEVRKIALQNGIDIDNPKPGTVMLTPPKLSDEDEGSQFMPKAYQCDGCTAVAYQLKKNFDTAEKRKKKDESLSEAEILTVTEEVCNMEYKEYGLKNVQGRNYLSGEGLEANQMSGMVESGGKWAKRLQNICKEVMGEFEEETVYSFFRTKEVPLKSFICQGYCRTGAVPIRDEF